MPDGFPDNPLALLVAVALLGVGMIYSFKHLNRGWGIPCIAVLATTAAWYVGDYYYNYDNSGYQQMFSPEVRSAAWWQVSLFVFCFLALVRSVHQRVNNKYEARESVVIKLMRGGRLPEHIQKDLGILLWICVATWAVLSIIAISRLRGQSLSYFLPVLGEKANPWMRDRIGGGFDALLSLASYAQLLLTASFGVLAALLRGRNRAVALAACAITMPYFLLDRTRNAILTAAVPGLTAWAVFRIRGGLFKKGMVLLLCFLATDVWFRYIIMYRNQGSISSLLHHQALELGEVKQSKHLGLNMYEELCWINSFLEHGTMTPDHGRRYLAELVNPIPRTLWPGKPTVGIDYAILRGQERYDDQGAGVHATISTGLVGQGVVNFGRVAGPAFASLLMAFWVAVLARLDLRGHEFARIPLFLVAMVLTFNLGRDITFITLYPFIFGVFVVYAVEHFRHNTVSHGSAEPEPAEEADKRPHTRSTQLRGRQRHRALKARRSIPDA